MQEMLTGSWKAHFSAIAASQGTLLLYDKLLGNNPTFHQGFWKQKRLLHDAPNSYSPGAARACIVHLCIRGFRHGLQHVRLDL
jgi:hypothetical protein